MLKQKQVPKPVEKGVSGEKAPRKDTGKAYLATPDADEDDDESLDEMLGTTDVASPSPKKPSASPSRPQPAVT